MSESENHIRLVRQLISWLANNFFDGDDGCILADLPDKSLQQKPPRIKNYIPDVYVSCVSSDLFIIGEAKTARDVETNHTKDQIESFLQKCKEFDRSLFVFAVSWDLTRLAKALVKSVQRKIQAEKVDIIVLEKLVG